MNVAIVIPINGQNVINGNWTKHFVVLSMPQVLKIDSILEIIELYQTATEKMIG